MERFTATTFHRNNVDAAAGPAQKPGLPDGGKLLIELTEKVSV